jgi:predicted hotdog family 3-hydroxylacyl-ACP dehydratase
VTAPDIDLRKLLPHREPMILIDRLSEVHAEHLDAEVTIRPDSQFLRGGSVPVWVGVEYVAQACAAFAGMEAYQRGEPARAGFVLAVRGYKPTVSGFELGSRLRVRVTLVHRDPSGLSMVEGKITLQGSETALVESTMTVYEVPDLLQFLAENRGAR